MRKLYPEVEPYAVYQLPVDAPHRIYVEECGNPHGTPVLFLHGGPGSGCRTIHRRFFDPQNFRIVLYDQRGAGRSTPTGELRHNDTPHLLEDIECIRRHLGIERWLMFGGSWGATLALLYAERHPERVTGLVLRGVFLARRKDLDWFLASGAARIYPERWQSLLETVPEQERHDLVGALHRRLEGGDQVARWRVAKEWHLWSDQVILGEDFEPAEVDEHTSIGIVHKTRIELHYAAHRYFIRENQILDEAERLAHLPVVLVHGRRDLVCPVESAFSLHRRLPKSRLRILPKAAHLPTSPDMVDVLISAVQELVEGLH